MMNWKFSNDTEKHKLLEAFNKNEIKSILLFRCQKLGDMLTFLPTILCVKEMFLAARLTLMCREEGFVIAERIPFLKVVFAEDLKRIKKEAFDLMITSSQDAGWIRLKKKMDIRFAIGVLPESLKGVSLKHRWQYRYFTDSRIYAYSDHDVKRNLKIIEILDRQPVCNQSERTLWITTSERQAVLPFTADARSPLVIVSPSGSKLSKNWHPDYFAELCDRLINERKAMIIFIGKGELAKEQTDKIIKQMNGQSLSVVDKTTFGEMCALIERGDLLISVDSGTAHVASYLNRPLVVIFGPGDFEQWRPWHENSSLGVALKVPCKCGTTDEQCHERRHCLDALMPDEVFEASCKLLDSVNDSRKVQRGEI